MPFGAAECRGQKRTHELFGQRWTDDARAEAEHIHVVILDALPRGKGVMAERRPDAGELAGRYRGTDATAAQQHPPLGLTVTDRGGYGPCVVGVIVSRFQLRCAAVQNFVPSVPNGLQDGGFERESRVVGADGDDHENNKYVM